MRQKKKEIRGNENESDTTDNGAEVGVDTRDVPVIKIEANADAEGKESQNLNRHRLLPLLIQYLFQKHTQVKLIWKFLAMLRVQCPFPAPIDSAQSSPAPTQEQIQEAIASNPPEQVQAQVQEAPADVANVEGSPQEAAIPKAMDNDVLPVALENPEFSPDSAWNSQSSYRI